MYFEFSFKRYFAVILLFLYSNNITLAETKNANSYITTSNISSIQHILDESSEDTLVIFDVDDVIIRPLDSAFYPVNKDLLVSIDKELSSRNTLKQMQNLWSIVFQSREHEVFDQSIYQILAVIQSKKIPTIALTNCGTGSLGVLNSLEDWRIETLKKLNIDFSIIAPVKDSYNFPLEGKLGKAMLKKGIIFTGGVKKGAVLLEFLSTYHLNYKKIIFIDNKYKNLESVGLASQNLGAEYLGVHYIPEYINRPSPLKESEIRGQFKILEEQNIWKSDKELLQ